MIMSVNDTLGDTGHDYVSLMPVIHWVIQAMIMCHRCQWYTGWHRQWLCVTDVNDTLDDTGNDYVSLMSMIHWVTQAKEMESEEYKLEAARQEAVSELRRQLAAETTEALRVQDEEIGMLIARLQVRLWLMSFMSALLLEV